MPAGKVGLAVQHHQTVGEPSGRMRGRAAVFNVVLGSLCFPSPQQSGWQICRSAKKAMMVMAEAASLGTPLRFMRGGEMVKA